MRRYAAVRSRPQSEYAVEKLAHIFNQVADDPPAIVDILSDSYKCINPSAVILRAE